MSAPSSAAPVPPHVYAPAPEDENIVRTAYDAQLRKLLAYVAGSLAGFLPLIEYAINAKNAPPGPLWHGFWDSFVILGSIVTVGFSWAALGSVYVVVLLERQLGTQGYGWFPGARPLIGQLGWRLWVRLQAPSDTPLKYHGLPLVIDFLGAGVLVFIAALAIFLLLVPIS